MGTPVNLLLIGSGEIRNELQHLITKAGLNDFCVFPGAIYDEGEIAPYLMLSDICVSPGNVGLTAMHAMAYGTPIISHNNPFTQGPEFEAILPGQTGAFFKEGSVESLTNTIHSWLEHSKGKRELIRRACYKRIEEHYTPGAQTKVFRQAIYSLIEEY